MTKKRKIIRLIKKKQNENDKGSGEEDNLQKMRMIKNFI